MKSALCAAHAALLALCLAPGALAAPLPQRTPTSVQGTSLGVISVEGVEFSRNLSAVVESPDSFAQLMVTELKRLGYQAHLASEGQAADFSLSGSWTEARCEDAQGKTCGAVIDWTLQDTRGGTVYRVKTRNEEDQVGKTDAEALTEKLLLGGLHSLLSREKFRAATRPVDPSQSGALPAATVRRCKRSALVLPKDSEQAIDATAVVRTDKGVGSAVVISPDGYLLTAAHVVEGAKTANILFRQGAKQSARVVRYDAEGDVALLQLESGQASACLDLQVVDPAAGQELYVIGAPAGEKLSFSISRGILSGRRTIDHFDYLQTDASVNPGNSGGPMVDAQGLVLGVVSWKLSGRGIEGLGFAVPAPAALRLLSLSLADASSSSLANETAAARLRKTVVDSPDPAWTVVGSNGGMVGGLAVSSSYGSSGGGSSVWPPLLISLGTTAIAAGGTMIAISAASYNEYSSRSDYFEARSWNDAGWITAGAGATMIAAALIIPALSSGSSEDPTKTSWLKHVEPRVGPLSVGVKVNY
ncbi:MAG TPA: trypsin-like peptidase domain-containing protein [Polyangiaceae bacterium]|nr:trypsin-like peptidase domain-containing protein [Polyangiaceae bacterium]